LQPPKGLVILGPETQLSFDSYRIVAALVSLARFCRGF